MNSVQRSFEDQNPNGQGWQLNDWQLGPFCAKRSLEQEDEDKDKDEDNEEDVHEY